MPEVISSGEFLRTIERIEKFIAEASKWRGEVTSSLATLEVKMEEVRKRMETMRDTRNHMVAKATAGGALGASAIGSAIVAVLRALGWL